MVSSRTKSARLVGAGSATLVSVMSGGWAGVGSPAVAGGALVMLSSGGGFVAAERRVVPATLMSARDKSDVVFSRGLIIVALPSFGTKLKFRIGDGVKTAFCPSLVIRCHGVAVFRQISGAQIFRK